MLASSSQPGGTAGARISRPALGALISAAIAILVAALLQANSVAIGSFLDDSSELAQTEAALVATQLSLRTLSQAVVLAEDVELGVADRETAETAAAEAARVTTDLEDRLNGLDITVVADTAIADAHATLAALDAGDVATAGDLLAGSALTSHQELHDAIVALRDDVLVTLDSAQGWTRRIGTVAGFLIALLAPALAIYAYWRIARRQVDSARVEMDTKLKAERRVLQAKDEFISNISHELRTPLTSIYGFSEVLIEQGLIDPEEAHTLISVINEESAELNRMVEDLLTVARDDAGEIVYSFGDFDLAAEISTVTRPLTRSGIPVEVASKPVWIHADQLRTRQILRNLLSNAQKWGGPDIYVTCHNGGDRAIVAVADNGSGVPADTERRLFSRYMHEGDSALTTGTVGLGLAVARILANGMGGGIRYERDEGWTRFVLELPLAQTQPAASETEERPVGIV